jgi:hypothetical protein
MQYFWMVVRGAAAHMLGSDKHNTEESELRTIANNLKRVTGGPMNNTGIASTWRTRESFSWRCTHGCFRKKKNSCRQQKNKIFVYAFFECLTSVRLSQWPCTRNNAVGPCGRWSSCMVTRIIELMYVYGMTPHATRPWYWGFCRIDRPVIDPYIRAEIDVIDLYLGAPIDVS